MTNRDRPSKAAEARSEGTLGWILRAAAVGFLLSGPRAALVLARFGDLAPVPNGLAASAALGTLAHGLWLSIPAAGAALLLAAAVDRRAGAAAERLVRAALFGLGFLFVTHRLPASSLFAPGWEGARALSVQLVAAGCALLAAWLARPRRLPRASATLGVASAVAACGAPLLGILSAPPAAAWPERPNVVLISLDTLRPDRLTSYGYERDTSPNIARFFEEGWRFEGVLAPDAWTLTCHVSMLTGFEPSVHGVNEERALPADLPTLADRMGAAGYRTMAIVDDCPWVDARYGLGRGFELYRSVEQGAAEKVQQVIELVEAAGDAPFFAFLHCYDAHSDFGELPYEAAPEDLERFAGPDWASFAGRRPDGELGASAWLQQLNERGEVLGPEERAWLSDLYDAGIATLDRDLARLFDHLESSGRTRDTVVILTSDHGEEFYEHGQGLHSQFYAEHLRVPLLVRTPDSRAASFEVLGGLVDIAPTVLELCGLEFDSPSDAPSAGRSLLEVVRGARMLRPYLPAEAKDAVVALRDSEGALVRDEDGWELFDRTEDPAELRDLSQDPAAKEMEQALRRFLQESAGRARERAKARRGSGTRVELEGDALERLRGLGYVGDD